MLPQIHATRFVTPLREGGSLPGIVEADDDGTYVVKFRGAGQGLKVLVAEVLVSGIANVLQIPTPELAEIDLSDDIARYEADEEVQDLLTASVGSNLAVDYLPGSFGYDGSRLPEPDLAARILWMDAFTANVDRTWANPNLLTWHRQTWAIDHGAALYFHHSWPSRAPDAARFAAQAFDPARHVLLEVAAPLEPLDAQLRARLTGALDPIIDAVPAAWLESTADLPDATAVRAAYRDALTARLESRIWLPGGAR